MTHHEWQLICIAVIGVFYLVVVGLVSLIDNKK